jgi:hypothetical protein
MNHEEDRAKDALDGYLDRALAAHGDNEPRPGLQQRVLAHLQAVPKRGVGWIWVAVPAASALALLIWAALYLSLPHPPRPAEVPTSARREAQRSSAPVGESQKTALANGTHAMKRRIFGHDMVAAERQRKKLPKLPTFPSAQPLSEPERLLIALGQRDPEQLRKIADWQEDFKKPLDPGAWSPEKDEK